MSEDRISKLPDDLINHILSYVDSKVAVKTMLLSKRWVNVWTTLSSLSFESELLYKYEKFAKFFFKYRNQQCDISKVTINCFCGSERMLTMCLDYVLSHNAEHLSIKKGDFADSPRLNSARVTTLKLENCINLCSADDWSLPSLTCLYLENVLFGNKISRFDNLKDLTLVENEKSSEIITINCPNLQSLSLKLVHPHTLIVSAPSLSYLSLRSIYVPAGFPAREGFPCMKQVNIDTGYYCCGYYYGENTKSIKCTMQKFIGMLNAVRETLHLEISRQTVKVFFFSFHSLFLHEHFEST